jgi:hypothetical protein
MDGEREALNTEFESLLWADPITRWKRDVPKIGCRLPELDPNFCRTDHAVPAGEHDAAFLLFTIERMLQKKLLIRRYFGCQID